MPDNRQVQNNVASNQSADNIEEAILRLKINDNNQEVGVSKSGSYPDRPGEPDCSYYLRTGSCGYGSNCRFNHPAYDAQQGGQYQEELPERVGQPDCGYFLKIGTCKYGSTCKYNHPKDRNGAGPVTFNILGLPMRQDEKSCPYFMRTGSCKFGVACKFHHPQPASPEGSLPVNGPLGSSVLPPAGVPYAGGLPTWSSPTAPFVTGPRLQTQSYMPVVFSPSQNIIPANGWSTYMGNMSSVSSGILGSNYAYTTMNPAESGSSGQMLLSSTSATNYPERPDQPECRYYMNTGTCKYGSDCKYHHPKERIANSSVNNVGPLGLPSRPGQPACSSYTMYGLCKYGPTCRFDHPYLGYPYNYPLSLPLSVFDTSLLTYQRMSPTAQLSEAPQPSRHLDWSWNTDPLSKKHQNLETKNSDDLAEEVSSPPHSLQTSSKTTHDQN